MSNALSTIQADDVALLAAGKGDEGPEEGSLRRPEQGRKSPVPVPPAEGLDPQLTVSLEPHRIGSAVVIEPADDLFYGSCTRLYLGFYFTLAHYNGYTRGHGAHDVRRMSQHVRLDSTDTV